MFMGQSGYSMGQKWTCFCTCATKVTTSSKGLTLKMNDKPPLVDIFVTLCIHKTLSQINYITIVFNWKKLLYTLSDAWISCWEVWNPAGADYVSRLTFIIYPSHEWCMVRTALSPLIWHPWLAYLNQVQCHYSLVPWIAFPQTYGSLIGSHPLSPSTSTSPFFIFPSERVS
jgi:hypothetical protein